MASEVKVLVKAENQTKTGFQAALNDAKKFGQEATKAATPGGGGSGGGELRKALKGLGGDLAQASTPAEALQAVVTRVAGAFGKVTAVVGAFAVGKIIAGQFEKLSEGVSSSTARLNQFTESAKNVGSALTLESALSGFDSMQSGIKAAQSELQTLSSDFGALAANVLTGGAAFRVMRENIEAMQRVAAASLVSSTALQAKQAEETAAAMMSGGKGAVDELAIKQARQREISALQTRLDEAINSGDGNSAASIRASMENKRREFGAQDAFRAAAAQQAAQESETKAASVGMTPEQRLAKEKQAMDELLAKQKQFATAAAMAGGSFDPSGALNSGKEQYYELEKKINESLTIQRTLEQQIAQEAEKAAKTKADQERAALSAAQEQAKKNKEAAMTPQERLQYEMQGLQDLAGMAGPEVEAQRQAAIGRIMSLQQQMAGGGGGFHGSQGASAFQRIGFASNEFFDTRKGKDPGEETRKLADIAKDILNKINSGNTLLLKENY